MPIITSTVMGTIAMGGALLQSAASVFQGYQAQDAGNKQQEIANENAAQVEKYAAEEEANFRQQGEQMKGMQKVMIGASGVEESGTPLLLMAETARRIEKDALIIRQRGSDEASRLRKMGEYYKQQGDAAVVGGWLNAGGTLLTQGANIYKSFFGNYDNKS